MAFNTFSCFSELPAEIRLAIWEFAVRPTGRGGGLHQFSILHVQETMDGILRGLTMLPTPPATDVPPYMAAVSRLRNTHGSYNKASNQSAYLWDAGLWTACTESRQVITKHFNCQQWHAAKKPFPRRFGNESSSAPMEIKSHDHDAIPATMTVKQNNEHWQLMVRPYQDLFCLTPINWGMCIDWETIFDSLPFSASSNGYGRVTNIAVEFDASWNFNWPETMDDLLNERTPRGLVARAVQGYIGQNVDMNIWLIDRCARRSPTTQETTTRRKIFHDCEQEYIETAPTEVMHDSEAEYTHTAAFFMEELDLLSRPHAFGMVALERFFEEFYKMHRNIHLGILTCSPQRG
ncbi:hypothetical protein EDB80DRAFT_772641 [Ilyonectria destructans]|nr:hypothetical protein EDB80DRAFT_772641 [Ilyonectria destructans]